MPYAARRRAPPSCGEQDSPGQEGGGTVRDGTSTTGQHSSSGRRRRSARTGKHSRQVATACGSSSAESTSSSVPASASTLPWGSMTVAVPAHRGTGVAAGGVAGRDVVLLLDGPGPQQHPPGLDPGQRPRRRDDEQLSAPAIRSPRDVSDGLHDGRGPRGLWRWRHDREPTAGSGSTAAVRRKRILLRTVRSRRTCMSCPPSYRSRGRQRGRPGRGWSRQPSP